MNYQYSYGKHVICFDIYILYVTYLSIMVLDTCSTINSVLSFIKLFKQEGHKNVALKRLTCELKKLRKSVYKRLAIENDDRVYTPNDLLGFCKTNGVPFVYDVHHHCCLKDGLSVEHVTEAALKTWNREPLFHISSPKFGWKSARPNLHHDFINIQDFSECWRDLPITVEVEAKAKELAVKKLRSQLLPFRKGI